MTTTAQNTKISPNFPARKYPGYVPSPQTLGRIAHKIYIDGAPPPPPPPPTGKPDQPSPFCAMNKYKMFTKNPKRYKIHINFFSSNILQKGDLNQMKPT